MSFRVFPGFSGSIPVFSKFFRVHSEIFQVFPGPFRGVPGYATGAGCYLMPDLSRQPPITRSARLGGHCMSLTPNRQACKTLILAMMEQGPDSYRRLKDLLQVIFDSHRMVTLEGQRTLLLECRLVPTMEALRVSFDLDLARATGLTMVATPLAVSVPAPAQENPQSLAPGSPTPSLTPPPSHGSLPGVPRHLGLLSPAVLLWMQPPTLHPPSRPRPRVKSSSKRHLPSPQW
jgi:hypothetical protein